MILVSNKKIMSNNLLKTIKWTTNQKHLFKVDIDRIPIVRDETLVFHFER